MPTRDDSPDDQLFECPFCHTEFRRLKTRPSQCPGCDRGYPLEGGGSHSSDALDHAARVSPEDLDRLDIDTGEPILAFMETEERKWAQLAMKVPRLRWIPHRAGGKVCLMRWRNRTAELLANMQPDEQGNKPTPAFIPVVGEVGKVSGVPLVVPARRWKELQRVLDEHDPGQRIEEWEEKSRERMQRENPPGRRHPYKPTEWQEDLGEMVRLRVILRGRYRRELWPDDLAMVDARNQDPDAIRYDGVRARWNHARKCKAWETELHYCGQWVPRGAKSEYCSQACRQAAKKARRGNS